ncbi:uncharacterized protein V6R79_010366 [Siganus canaliculatus]
MTTNAQRGTADTRHIHHVISNQHPSGKNCTHTVILITMMKMRKCSVLAFDPERKGRDEDEDGCSSWLGLDFDQLHAVSHLDSVLYPPSISTTTADLHLDSIWGHRSHPDKC